MSRLVDDWQEPREPSHSDLGAAFDRAGLPAEADPNSSATAQQLGKQKRVRQALAWCLDHDEAAGSRAVIHLIGVIRGCGGFLPDSSNYCGEDVIKTCVATFSDQPVELTLDGLLRPRSLAGLAGRDLTKALQSYVLRARKGFEDSVLVAGTTKDIIEATAAHVLTERFGRYEELADFPIPTLLGQAFVALGLDAQVPKGPAPGLPGARAEFSARLYQLGCAINRVRNKAGAGHGRPFVPELSAGEVRAATEAARLVAGRLLDALSGSP